MVKFAASVLVLLAAVFVVEGINIPPPRIKRSGRFFASSHIPSNITPNDPRCKENGVFSNLNDCTAFYACLNGTSQDRKCPEGMRFDTRRHCTFEEDADCGVAPLGKLKEEFKCPNDYGIYAYKADCHKYVVCVDSVPNVRTCPEKLWYQENVGCIKAEKCPQSANRRNNQLTDIIEN